MKNLTKKIQQSLTLKILKLKKEIRAYKNRITQDVLKEQEYIDKMSLMQDDIRQLLLKLPKEERELWLKEKGKDYERHTPKKKRVIKKIN